jgi:exonuclease III
MVNVSLLSWNANSLPLKELELLTYLREFDHVVCGVSEARMTSLGEGFKDISRAGFHVFGFPSFRQGVLVYASPELKIVPLNRYCVETPDFCAVTFKLHENIVCFAYCHDGNRTGGIGLLLDWMNEFRTLSDSIIVMGDLNARISPGNMNAAGRCLANRLKQGIWRSHCSEIATHQRHHIDYCLDLISSPSVSNCEVLEELSSDHAVISAQIATDRSSVPERTRCISWNKFKRKFMSKLPAWMSNLTVDENLQNFTEFCCASIEDCWVDVKTPASSVSKVSYFKFDRELIQMKRQRNRFKRNSPQWKKFNAIFRKMIRQKKRLHEHKRQEDAAAGKLHWHLLRQQVDGNSPAGRIDDSQAVAEDFSNFTS